MAGGQGVVREEAEPRVSAGSRRIRLLFCPRNLQEVSQLHEVEQTETKPRSEDRTL